MTSPRPTERTNSALTRDLYDAARYYLGGRRGLLILAAILLAAGLALNWSWLVAAGIAPILISVLPCLAMCALGLCMNKMTGKSCASDSTATVSTETAADREAPAIRTVTVEAPTARAAGELPAIVEPLGDTQPQPPKERSTTDA